MHGRAGQLAIPAYRFGLLTSWPITPPTAAPPTVPSALPPLRAEPATPPTPAPIAVFLSCVDMPLQPIRLATATAQAALYLMLFIFNLLGKWMKFEER